MTEPRKVDWRGVGLYRADGSSLEESYSTKAKALAARRAALIELRTAGRMTGVWFDRPAAGAITAEVTGWTPEQGGYTAEEIDWTAFDLRFDLHLMPAEPGGDPTLLESFDSPEIATAAAKRYVKKHPGTRVEVTTVKREDA